MWFPLMAFLLSGCVSTAFSFTLWLRERAHFTVISAEMTRASRVRSPFGMVPWQDVWLLLRLRERAHFTIISADSARFGARPSLRIDSLRVRSGSSTVSWDLVRLVFFLWSDVVFPRRGFNTFRILFWILLPILLRILFFCCILSLKGVSPINGFLYRRTGRNLYSFYAPFLLQLVIGDEDYSFSRYFSSLVMPSSLVPLMNFSFTFQSLIHSVLTCEHIRELVYCA